MQTYAITNAQARRFLLRHHGLLGEHRFHGPEGVLAYIRQCGCIQYDPIDVCGKNTELVLQSRVAGFTKQMLHSLLYEDRKLVDYFDKNLSVFPVEDWPYFERERALNRSRGLSMEAGNRVAAEVLSLLAEHPHASARDLNMNEKASWYWSDSSLARVTLETLYFRGDLCIHHKQGTNKRYALAENCIPAHLLGAEDPNPCDAAHRNWRMLRRIGAVGMLWNKSSHAFLCIDGLKDGGRSEGFAALASNGDLLELTVEGIPEPLYAPSKSNPLLQEILAGESYAPRTELIAPLDCLL